MNFLLSIVIALSLSMDAFSLALSVGTMGISKKNILLISLTVGLFHFFMPLFGSILGTSFMKYFNIDVKLLSGIIFAYIAIQMFKEYKEDKKEIFKFELLNIIIFAFGVSLDSFGVGFTMNKTIYEVMKSGIIFSIVSSFFTFIGLFLGKCLKRIVGDYAILLGTIIMGLISLINFVNFCAFNLH